MAANADKFRQSSKPKIPPVQGWWNFKASAFIIPGTAIALLAALDQLTKAIARSSVAQSRCMDVLPGFLQVVQGANTGMAWGMLKGSSPFIAVLSVPVAAILFVAYIGLKQRLQRLGIVLMAAGLLGNTVDRLVRGAVTDFIYFPALPNWPGAFNLADVFLFTGAALIFTEPLVRFFASRSEQKGHAAKQKNKLKLKRKKRKR